MEICIRTKDKAGKIIEISAGHIKFRDNNDKEHQIKTTNGLHLLNKYAQIDNENQIKLVECKDIGHVMGGSRKSKNYRKQQTRRGRR